MIRTEGKYISDFNINDIYKHYVEQQKLKNKSALDRNIFGKILSYHNREVCKNIVENSGEYRLPYRLGYLRIRKHKTRIKIDANGNLKTEHLKPDWKATNELWSINEEAKLNKKIVYHTNTHSKGFYCKWFWDKRVCNIKNSSVYSLIISRAYKRLLSQTIKTNDSIDYYE